MLILVEGLPCGIILPESLLENENINLYEDDDEYYSAEEDIDINEQGNIRRRVIFVDVGTQTDISAIDNICNIM